VRTVEGPLTSPKSMFLTVQHIITIGLKFLPCSKLKSSVWLLVAFVVTRYQLSTKMTLQKAAVKNKTQKHTINLNQTQQPSTVGGVAQRYKILCPTLDLYS